MTVLDPTSVVSGTGNLSTEASGGRSFTGVLSAFADWKPAAIFSTAAMLALGYAKPAEADVIDSNMGYITSGAGCTAGPSPCFIGYGATVPVSGTVTATLAGTVGASQVGAFTVGISAGQTVSATIVGQPVGVSATGGTITSLQGVPPWGVSATGGTVSTSYVGTQGVSVTAGNVGVSITGGTGTVTGTVSTNADGSIAVGAAPSKELVTGGVYNSAKVAPTNGQVMANQFDSAGNQNSAIAPSPDVLNMVTPGAGAGASQVFKTAAGGMMEVHFSNYTTGTQMFAMLFNGTAIPANGAVTAGIASTNLQECAALNPNGVVTFGNRIGPYEKFANGIVAAVSTNAAGCVSLTSATSGYFINGSIQ